LTNPAPRTFRTPDIAHQQLGQCCRNVRKALEWRKLSHSAQGWAVNGSGGHHLC
jgi:hypothetical protein